MQRLVQSLQDIPIDKMEKILPFTISPWEDRIPVFTQDEKKAFELAQAS
jgi:hypothetical protein